MTTPFRAVSKPLLRSFKTAPATVCSRPKHTPVLPLLRPRRIHYSFRRTFSAAAQVAQPQVEDVKKVLTEDEVKMRAKVLLDATLGDLVNEAKKRRQPESGKKFNISKHKNYFVTAINDNATVKDTVDFMVDRQVGSLFVVDKEYNITGYVTEHHIVSSMTSVLKPSKEDNETFEEVMASVGITEVMKPVEKVQFAKMDTKVLESINLMRQFGFRHLPVLKQEAEAPTDIKSIEHIVSVKGLISTMYNALMETTVDHTQTPNSHSLDEDLEKLEKDVSDCFKLPPVKQVLNEKNSNKGGKILNTDIEDDISVLAAVEEMQREKVGYVAVMNFSKENEAVLLGIVTERDVLMRVVAEMKDPSTTLVRDVMTKKLLMSSTDPMKLASVTSDMSLLTCMRYMSVYDLRHLPVLSKTSGKITGIITSKDIINALCQCREKFKNV